MYTTYRVLLNGNDITIFAKTGVVITHRIDEELDNCILRLHNTNQSTPYEPFSVVSFELVGHNTPDNFYLLSDEVIRQANDNTYYQHNLTLIEPTKFLEKIMLPNLTFRQPQNNEWDKYTIATALAYIREQCPLYDATKQFEIDPTLATDSTIIPELSFNQNNVREAINKVLAVINARCKAYISNGVLYVGASYYNKLNNLITIETSKTFEWRKNKSADYYGSSLETRVENGTQKYATLKYPSVAWASLTSSEKNTLTSENAVFETPFPIYKVEKLEIFANIKNSSGDPKVQSLDITDYVVSKDIWDVLPEPNQNNYYTTTAHKGNRLYFEVGDNKIYNAFTMWGSKEWLTQLLGIKTSTLDIIIKLMQGVWGQGGIYSLTLFDFMWRGCFSTSISSTIRNYKEDNMGSTQIFNNQSDNLLDLLDFGNSNYGIISKVGNAEYDISKITTGGSEYVCGDYTTDGYIVSAVTNSYQKDGYVLSSAKLTKNFNQISKYIGVDSSIRQVPIPYDQPTARLHYDDFCIISNTKQTTPSITSCANDKFLAVFAKYLGGAF